MGFLICAGCNRHVKCGDEVCPFCGKSVSNAKPAGDAKLSGARTRSKLLFGAVAGLVATSATASCSDSSSVAFYGAASCGDGPCTVQDSGDQGDAIVAFYGAPNLDSGSKDATEDTSDDAADDAADGEG